jgi:hypothetical protein
LRRDAEEEDSNDVVLLRLCGETVVPQTRREIVAAVDAQPLELVFLDESLPF